MMDFNHNPQDLIEVHSEMRDLLKLKLGLFINAACVDVTNAIIVGLTSDRLFTATGHLPFNCHLTKSTAIQSIRKSFQLHELVLAKAMVPVVATHLQLPQGLSLDDV